LREDIQAKLNALTPLIAQSYKKHKHISHLNCNNFDCENLPEREEIIDIVLRLRELLFPGYFDKQRNCVKTIDFMISEHISYIYERLYKQIYKSFMLQNRDNISRKEEIMARAQENSYTFLQRIPNLRDILSMDVQATYDGDPAASSIDEVIFSYPGVFAITVHRIAHELHMLGIPLIPRIMSEYAHTLTGIDIHPGAKIGKYFFIDHGTGIVIGETTVIGDFVKIYQGVTLGALSLKAGQRLKGTKRHPTLEDNVIVYAGASILGGETIIGEGVVIGSNVFITRSVTGKTNVSLKNQDLIYMDKASKRSRKKDDDNIVIDWVI
jgi:serine O-acetyltransferase